MSSKRKIRSALLTIAFVSPVITGVCQQGKPQHDFSGAKIMTYVDLSGVEQAAVQMLVEEVEKRTLINLKTTVQWPDTSVPVIALGTSATLKNGSGPFPDVVGSSSEAEGFSVKIISGVRKAPTVFIIGNDVRGLLFGVGYFLRKISMKQGEILVPNDVAVETHPIVPLRGHQLGYRPKTNSYDGFDVSMWEQYIRDLIVFGTNAIEILPLNTDDDASSRMFPLPPMEMMIQLDRLLAKYGLENWIWYPLMYGDYSNAENVKKSLAENESIFSQLSKIDALFVPGGDPGHAPPKVLFSYLEKQANVLRKYHPNAEMWVSPQGFNSQWLDTFLQLVKEEPEWLTGIAHGPWIRMTVNELRKAIPAKYPIRKYPDITHSLQSQFPVPDWDFAFAATANREGINPRPVGQSAIFHSSRLENYLGFITYSEGINDDVNKIVWSGLGWNPSANLIDILHDYSRYFIGPEYTYDFAQGILDLEENWNGPLIGNTSVYTTLRKFQVMEKRALPKVRLNWRFQQALYRSYYDAYNRSRLLYETQLEDEAMSVLRNAAESGSLAAMKKAADILAEASFKRVAEDWRQKVFELAEALFQSTRMQLSVDKYFAIRVERGANLDLIGYPLNDRTWLEDQFNRISAITDEKNRLAEIEKIVNWTNPGPGGFYDDLGDLENQPHLVKGKRYEEDPEFVFSPFVGFDFRTRNWRVSWKQFMHTKYEHPLKMHYSNLDRTARYQVKVTYVSGSSAIRLMADEDIKVHDYIKRAVVVEPFTFDIPMEATKDGELTLMWNSEPGLGGSGRHNQVAEVWLMKKQD